MTSTEKYNRLMAVMERAISELARRFQESPLDFFTESDLHSWLYRSLLEIPELSRRYGMAEASGETLLVHREYPTFFRFREGLPVEKTGPPASRGHYDLVVLNPEFVTTYPAEVVTNQSFSKTEGKTWPMKPILAAIEVKLLRRKPSDQVMEDIEIDFQVLQQSNPWVSSTHMLVFNRWSVLPANQLRELERMAKENTDVTLLYVEPRERTPRKPG